MKNIHKAIATVFSLGYSPAAPGTVGSLAGLLLCLLLHGYQLVYALVFVLIFASGTVSSGIFAKNEGIKDPPYIIIDEFTCIFAVYLFIPITPAIAATGFVLYRIFDILKPPPLKRLERVRGGWGIMLDDLAAAVYANLILRILF